MKAWLRRADPGFYYKEPDLLRAQAQIGRYTEDAQAEVRLRVLADDLVLHVATVVGALAAYVAVTGGGTLAARPYWPTLWALSVLAVAGPRALPWWPARDRAATWRHAVIALALVALPALWTRFDLVLFGVALLSGASLFAAQGENRLALLVLAVAVLFGSRAVAPHAPVAPAIVGGAAAGASVLAARTLAGAWRVRPQLVTWAALALVLLACAYTFGFNANAVGAHLPLAIAAVAVAYLAVCVIAGRIRRAEVLARPGGVLTIPQSVVPLLDRSHDHAIICRHRD